MILITAWGSIALAVEGMKAGAADFVTKPWSNAHVLAAIATALELEAALAADPSGATTARAELDRRYALGALVGDDPLLLRLLDLVGRVAPTDAPVLITGESGTGKELVAEAIHSNSRRRDGPFVKVNLGGIAATLFESEMFGHVRGAFTDARADRKGRFEVAEGGTIFLDEIGELEPSAQVKLLRVLQDRTYEVLGSSRTRSVDLRVVAATNRNLAEMVAAGQFREDLLYRLNLIAVELPPLRARRGDVPLLARHFLDLAARTHGRAPIRIAPRAIEWLTTQPWPGNIRQLRQTIERAVLMIARDSLEVEDLVALAEFDPGRRPARSLPDAGNMTLDEMERAMIEKSLVQLDFNLTRVAAALGLSRAALYRRLKKYGLDTGRP